jgi:hypothetical protein
VSEQSGIVLEVVDGDNWIRTIDVAYQRAGGEWRPATEGEKCGKGGGGHGAHRSKACGQPAYVARVTQRGGALGQYTERVCEVHCGGRLVLEDDTVIEPVTNPLGGA